MLAEDRAGVSRAYQKKLPLRAFFIFLVIFTTGFLVSQQKYLWNDEVYTITESINGRSYWSIIKGDVSEGNNCPLFYLLEKMLFDLFHCEFPDTYLNFHTFYDQKIQAVCRFIPIVSMSLAVAGLYYFFALHYSSWVGTYAVLLTISSFMFWAHWLEVRHYASWFLLTTVQSLLFIDYMRQPKPLKGLWKLTVLHLFFSLTVIFSMVQIFFVSMFLWIFKERNWKKYLSLTFLPITITLFYYSRTQKFYFKVVHGFSDLIFANFPRERIGILFVYALFLVLYSFCRKRKCKNFFPDSLEPVGIPYFFLTLFHLGVSSLILFLMSLKTRLNAKHWLSNRYILFLTPIGIISTVLFSVDLYRAFEGRRRIQWMLIVLFIFLVFLRVRKMYYHLPSLYQ